MSRVELYEKIRKDRRQGLSIRELARKYRVHRRNVREALRSSVPPARKAPVRACPSLGPYKAWVDAVLEADTKVPPKQRHTAKRIYERLRDEQGAVVGESTERAYVGRRRREVANMAKTVTIAQVHNPGEEAEVDFGECWAHLAGVVVKLWMFVMRLSASGRAFHRLYANQAQEAFLDGHVRALEVFGGCVRRVRYDNLTPAVVKVLRGRSREENERFVALRSHYGFDSFFCVPGKQGAHETRWRGGRNREVPPRLPRAGPQGGGPRRAERGLPRRRRERRGEEDMAPPEDRGRGLLRRSALPPPTAGRALRPGPSTRPGTCRG